MNAKPLEKWMCFDIVVDGVHYLLDMMTQTTNRMSLPQLYNTSNVLLTNNIFELYQYLNMEQYLPQEENSLERILYELEQPDLWNRLIPNDHEQWSDNVHVSYKNDDSESYTSDSTLILHYDGLFSRQFSRITSFKNEPDMNMWLNFDVTDTNPTDWYEKTLKYKGFIRVFQQYLRCLDGYEDDFEQVKAYTYLVAHHELGLLAHYMMVQPIMSLPDFLRTNQWQAELELLWD